MKKLTLDPESLRVQSFAAAAEMRHDAAAPIPNAAATRPQICDPVTVWC